MRRTSSSIARRTSRTRRPRRRPSTPSSCPWSSGSEERRVATRDGSADVCSSDLGPLPQTRFVLRKALAASLPVIIVVNKTARPDARIDEVVEDAQDLLLDLAAGLEDEEAQAAAEHALELPVVF